MQVALTLKPYIQPFEKRLAFEELQALTGQTIEPETAATEYTLRLPIATAELLADRLAYWQWIENGARLPTRQAIHEATATVARPGLTTEELRKFVPFAGDVPLPNRRVLRYSTHGIHEYRGKFFPQLVRALLNVSGAERDSLIADPMSGSGTTAVESVLSHCHALAIDMNPLSVFVGRTKCALLTVAPEVLDSLCGKLRTSLQRSPRKRRTWIANLPNDDQRYLSNWFAPEVLSDLDAIATAILNVKLDAVRDFMFVALSNVLRRVSWQKEDDLRVRKEIRLNTEIDAVAEFLTELGRSLRIVLASLYQNGPLRDPKYSFGLADARESATFWRRHVGRVQAIITSPPYATALPYLDTDRLSLIFLGLLARSKHRTHDLQMIGNREITERRRREAWASFEAHSNELPDAIGKLIRRIETLNGGSDVGFRRRNIASLLSTYFFDMKQVFEDSYKLLSPSGAAHFVVGTNHTIAGGEKVEIDTPSLLALLAESTGFRVVSVLPMEMLPSRDIFRANTGTGESIISLARRQ